MQAAASPAGAKAGEEAAAPGATQPKSPKEPVPLVQVTARSLEVRSPVLRWLAHQPGMHACGRRECPPLTVGDDALRATPAPQEVEKQYKEGSVKAVMVQVLKAVQPGGLAVAGARAARLAPEAGPCWFQFYAPGGLVNTRSARWRWRRHHRQGQGAGAARV